MYVGLRFKCVTSLCPIVIKIGICQQILIKVPNFILHEISSGGRICVPSGETDGHDEANNVLSHLLWEVIQDAVTINLLYEANVLNVAEWWLAVLPRIWDAPGS